MVHKEHAYLLINKHHPHHVLTSVQIGTTPPLFAYEAHKHDYKMNQTVIMYKDIDWLIYIQGQILENTTTGAVQSAAPPLDSSFNPKAGNAATFQWTLGTKDDKGFRRIQASNGDYLYLNSSKLVKTSSSKHDDHGLWKFVPLPSFDDLDQDDADGKSASDWKQTAEYIFQEGLNFIGGTPVTSINTPELRQSWVDLWKKMGQRRDVYPHPQSPF